VLGAFVLAPQLVMKFPSKNGDMITIYGDQKIVRGCYIASLKVQPKRIFPKIHDEKMMATTDLDP